MNDLDKLKSCLEILNNLIKIFEDFSEGKIRDGNVNRKITSNIVEFNKNYSKLDSDECKKNLEQLSQYLNRILKNNSDDILGFYDILLRFQWKLEDYLKDRNKLLH